MNGRTVNIYRVSTIQGGARFLKIRSSSRPTAEWRSSLHVLVCVSVQIWGPKMQSGAPNLYGDANKVYMIFIQWSAGRSDSIVQQTINFNQRTKGNLGGQNCSNREHEYIRRPDIVKTCLTCRRYTVKSHAWENHKKWQDRPNDPNDDPWIEEDDKHGKKSMSFL